MAYSQLLASCSVCGSTNLLAQRGYDSPTGFGHDAASTAGQSSRFAWADGYSLTIPRGVRFVDYLLDALLSVLTLGIGWVIWLAILAPSGRTPSKQLLRLVVVDFPGGKPAAWWKVWLRHYLPNLLGILIAPFSFLGWFSLPFAFALALQFVQLLAALIPLVDSVFVFGPARRRLVDFMFKTTVTSAKDSDRGNFT